MVPDRADGAGGESRRIRGQRQRRGKRDPGIDSGVEERVEMIVLEWDVGAFMHLTQTPVVAAEHQKHRGIRDPWATGEERVDRSRAYPGH